MYSFLCFVLLMGVEGNAHMNSSEDLKNETSTTMEETSQEDQSFLTNQAATTLNLPNQPSDTTPKSKSPQSHYSTTTAQDKSQATITEPFFCIEDLKKPLPLVVIGALAIASFTLLITTLVLACNVCCLKRQMSSSYRVCSDTAQATTQSATKTVSVDGEHSETALMMNEITNCKPEGDENHTEPEKPEKPEETAQEVDEVPNQASTEDFAQNENPTAESPPNQECMLSGEDAVISE